MSMLSMQIDSLRSHADLYDGTTKPEMAKELQRPYLAQELREAADTIWELRDDLQRANDAVRDAEHDESRAWDRVRKAEADNAKLRDELDAAKHDLSLFSERIVELGAENDKLRELTAGIGHLLFPLDVDYCAICPRDDINHPCPVHTVKGGECLYKTDLRELGVEVSE